LVRRATLVRHYVAFHEYCPPLAFIEAVTSPVAVGTDYGWNLELDAMRLALKKRRKQ
jgi:hypothetical protein